MSETTTPTLAVTDASTNGQFVGKIIACNDRDSFTREVAGDKPDELDAAVSEVELKFGPDASGKIYQMYTEAVETHAQAHADLRHQVVIGPDEHRVTNEVLAALASDPELFNRGGVLARVIRDDRGDEIQRPTGAPTIGVAPLAWIRERITRHVVLLKEKQIKGEIITEPAHPPQWLPAAAASRGEYPMLRQLLAISDAPVLRPDGSIHQTPGYDRVTGVLFDSSTTFPPIPTDLSREDAVAAAKRLQDVVIDFRFEAPAHLSAWLAGLLTPLARHAFPGPAPAFLIDANVRGAGKGFMAQTIAMIATGRQMAVFGYVHDATEFGKRITSIAISGDAMVLLDNLTGTFGNEVLDRALTGVRWKDRILGVNANVDLIFLTVIFATGNNVMVAADTARRLIHIRLDVLDEKPEERAGFQHPDLLAWIHQNRPGLLADALTILAAYCRAGRPDQKLTPFGSFEGWSALVRSAIVWIGLPDPCETRSGLAENADTAADTLRQLIAAWKEYDPHGVGIIVADMVGRLYQREHAPTDAAAVAMRNALESMVSAAPGKPPTVRAVGNRLKSYRRRVVGNVYLDIDARHKDRNGATWRLYEPKVDK